MFVYCDIVTVFILHMLPKMCTGSIELEYQCPGHIGFDHKFCDYCISRFIKRTLNF